MRISELVVKLTGHTLFQSFTTVWSVDAPFGLDSIVSYLSKLMSFAGWVS